MSWAQTYSGVAFDFEHPSAEDVVLEDIAHALAMQCRWNGHTREFFSVAQHSVLVSDLVAKTAPEHALVALLHDAAEAYVGDVVRPLKHTLPAYQRAELRVWIAVALRFDVPILLPQVVKDADNILLATEYRDLMGSAPLPWGPLPLPLEDEIEPLAPLDARELFLRRFFELTEHRPHVRANVGRIETDVPVVGPPSPEAEAEAPHRGGAPRVSEATKEGGCR